MVFVTPPRLMEGLIKEWDLSGLFPCQSPLTSTSTSIILEHSWTSMEPFKQSQKQALEKLFKQTVIKTGSDMLKILVVSSDKLSASHDVELKPSLSTTPWLYRRCEGFDPGVPTPCRLLRCHRYIAPKCGRLVKNAAPSRYTLQAVRVYVHAVLVGGTWAASVNKRPQVLAFEESIVRLRNLLGALL